MSGRWSSLARPVKLALRRGRRLHGGVGKSNRCDPQRDPSSKLGMDAPSEAGGAAGQTTQGSNKMVWSGELSERFYVGDGISPESSIYVTSSSSKKSISKMLTGMLNLKRKGRKSSKKAPPSTLPEQNVEMPEEDLLIGFTRFSRQQLRVATHDFSPSMQISEDGFKKGYTGNLQGNRVAVYRFHSSEKERLFHSVVRALSMLRHRNIEKGIGWCCEGDEIFIVNEAMENGTLFDHLHNPNMKPLPWDVRFKIALDLASAILYMHEQCEHCILHRDIKSSNVLIDSDFNAKLTSFDVSRIEYDAQSDNDTRVIGTVGYLDPEYAMTGIVSRSSDVYSFGVVLLEIATGRKAFYVPSTGNPTRLVELVGLLNLKEELLAVADERLRGEFDSTQMEQLITVGVRCTLPDRNMRPSIQEVVQFLKFGVALPNIDMEVQFPSRCSSPRSLMSSTPDMEEELLDSSKGKHVMNESGIDEKPMAPGETFDMIEKPVIHDEPSLIRGTFEIGIPSDYNNSGPLNDSQLQIMKGFVASLHENIESGVRFIDALETIKKFTSIIVMLQMPLSKWNSLAQHVLAEVQRMEALRRMHEGVEYRRAGTLSSLETKFEECLASVNEDRAKLVESKEKLASMEQERASSLSKFDDLQKQLVDLQNQMDDVEGTSNLSEDSIEIINHWRAQNVERIEYIESAILMVHESLTSRVLSFPFDGKIVPRDELRGTNATLRA